MNKTYVAEWNTIAKERGIDQRIVEHLYSVKPVWSVITTLIKSEEDCMRMIHERISKHLDDENVRVRYAAIRHPDVTDDHLLKGLDDEHKNVRIAAITHPNAKRVHVRKALNDEDRDVRFYAITIQLEKL